MLEDWANDGPPLSEAAAREMFEGLFRDDLTGTGRWQVAGAAIDPKSLSLPLLNIVSTTDRIVPSASAVRAGERLDLALGHVGVIRDGVQDYRPVDDLFRRNRTAMKAASAPSRNAGAAACEMTCDS